MRSPSTSTVQAPQAPWLQPFLVPVQVQVVAQQVEQRGAQVDVDRDRAAVDLEVHGNAPVQTRTASQWERSRRRCTECFGGLRSVRSFAYARSSHAWPTRDRRQRGGIAVARRQPKAALKPRAHEHLGLSRPVLRRWPIRHFLPDVPPGCRMGLRRRTNDTRPSQWTRPQLTRLVDEVAARQQSGTKCR